MPVSVWTAPWDDLASPIVGILPFTEWNQYPQTGQYYLSVACFRFLCRWDQFIPEKSLVASRGDLIGCIFQHSDLALLGWKITKFGWSRRNWPADQSDYNGGTADYSLTKPRVLGRDLCQELWFLLIIWPGSKPGFNINFHLTFLAFFEADHNNPRLTGCKSSPKHKKNSDSIIHSEEQVTRYGAYTPSHPDQAA